MNSMHEDSLLQSSKKVCKRYKAHQRCHTNRARQEFYSLQKSVPETRNYKKALRP